MALDRMLYRLTYRLGTPRWDTGVPQPELHQLMRDRAPGRALDLGCGTGADVVYLASHGWETVGIDFAPEAVAAAKKKAADAGVTAAFVLGDASRLADAGVRGPFDLLLDIDCYHSIPASRRDAYVAGPPRPPARARTSTWPASPIRRACGGCSAPTASALTRSGHGSARTSASAASSRWVRAWSPTTWSATADKEARECHGSRSAGCRGSRPCLYRLHAASPVGRPASHGGGTPAPADVRYLAEHEPGRRPGGDAGL